MGVIAGFLIGVGVFIASSVAVMYLIKDYFGGLRRWKN